MKLIVLSFATFICISANAEPYIPAEDSARIVRAATRLVVAKPSDWTFAVITEMSSNKYVQFAAEDRVITFDFPIFAALGPHTPGRLRDGNCSAEPPAKKAGEVENRYRSKEEETRITKLLNTMQIQWRYRYCLSFTKEGQRVGYNLSIIGSLDAPKTVPTFVESVLKEAYLIPVVRGIRIETDE